MKHSPNTFAYTLTPDLQNSLDQYRRLRNFSASSYVEAKAITLNNYMREHNLSACVVAVSGGIDSAVVLGLVNTAKGYLGSPIKKIVPLLLPAFDSVGATGQSVATTRGAEVCERYGVDPIVFNVNEPLSTLLSNKNLLTISNNKSPEPWAIGQTVSYMRTPVLYHVSSVLSSEGMPAIVVGTTNYDEGGYIGFFGKASDGMVDVQLISDLHKSEVRRVASYLGTPSSIMNVSPTGDMYDGRIDEQVFGVSYDFIELMTGVKNNIIECQGDDFSERMELVEKLHQYNHHKYIGRSPAVHLDILHASVPKGWNNPNIFGGVDADPIHANWINHQPLTFRFSNYSAVKDDDNGSIISLVDPKEADDLATLISIKQWLPVHVDGYQSNYDGVVGSERLTSHVPHISDQLWKNIRGILTLIVDQNEVWRPVGIAPLLRFIRYQSGHTLIPHYDSSYVYHKNKKTLKSLVLYLTDGIGETRFIREERQNHKFDDWNVNPNQVSVIMSFTPKAGQALIFDHRTLHDSPPFKDGVKIVMRTDIIYERVG